MIDRPSPSPSIQRLVEYLLDGPAPGPELAELPSWLVAGPRFRDFADANRDKVRKKLRGARTAGARLDLRAELGVAALLLADRRIDLTFEAYGAGLRGPDFTVTFRAGRPFNVEVTRRLGGGDGPTLEPAVLGKLRQLPPSVSNVLVIAVDDPDGAPEPGPALRDLRGRADHRDDAFFLSRGVDGAAAFHAGLLRLAAVVTWADRAEPPARVAAWTNAGARIPLPEATRRAVLAALRGG